MRKIIYGASFIVAAMFMVAGSAQAGMITTTFANDNGQAGNMFDVTVFGNPLTVTGLDLNLDSGTYNVEVYSKIGTYVGSETNIGDWTLRSTNNGVVSSGAGLPTFVDISDFLLSSASVNGFYITLVNSTGINYTNGANIYSNADLQLNLGVGVSNPLGATFNPRTWNGTIYYTVGAPEQVPVPATLALFGLGLAGLGWSRRKNA